MPITAPLPIDHDDEDDMYCGAQSVFPVPSAATTTTHHPLYVLEPGYNEEGPVIDYELASDVQMRDVENDDVPKEPESMKQLPSGVRVVVIDERVYEEEDAEQSEEEEEEEEDEFSDEFDESSLSSEEEGFPPSHPIMSCSTLM